MSGAARTAVRPPAGAAAARAIEEAARLLAHDPAEAERRARAVLAAQPGDPRAALILASARRRRGDHQGARVLLEPLARAFPEAANTHYELGMARAAAGEGPGAEAALRRAVALNRELPLAWKALGELLFRRGDLKGADAAFAGHLRASVQGPELKAAADALAAAAPGRAEALVRAHLAGAPHDPAALAMLGDALSRQGRHEAAEAPLRTALERDPGFDGARFTLAGALFQQQKAAEALPHVRRLLDRDGDDPAYLNLMAACLGLLGEFAEVARINARLVAAYPDQPKVWLNLGHALRATGPMEEAAQAYRRCMALAPGLGDAYWSLANLKLERFTDADVAAMQGQLARGDLDKTDRLHLAYALGKALEDACDYEGSFAAYAEGARLRRAEGGYCAETTTADIKAAKARLTPAFFAARPGGEPARDPIFIVGLPRSGSTLVEQILASHSRVEGTMELPDVGLIARSLAARCGGAREGEHLTALAALDAAGRAALGRGYLEATRVHRKLGRPSFIDKMPNNFRLVGLIHLILPNARILDVRRHPMAAGFAAFKQHFAQGQGFSYDLEDIGRYYRDYVELMDHVDAVLPGRVHRVIYEDLVEDTEGEVRRLLAACGLGFEEGCLRFYENERAVRTVSSEQVRRPIFRSGLEQWKAYAPWLGPLEAALGPALQGWRGAGAAVR